MERWKLRAEFISSRGGFGRITVGAEKTEIVIGSDGCFVLEKPPSNTERILLNAVARRCFDLRAKPAALPALIVPEVCYGFSFG